MTDQERKEAELLRQRVKNRKYYKILLQKYEHRRLIRWLLRGKHWKERKSAAIIRNLYRLMKADLDQEGHNPAPPADDPPSSPS